VSDLPELPVPVPEASPVPAMVPVTVPVTVSAEEPVVPATWTARDADVSWCPASLREALDAGFVLAAGAEPRTIDARAAGWQVTGAGVRGRSHAHRGEHRDDALAIASRDDVLVLAVADGAGSSALSRIGAAVTAQFAVENTLTRLAAATDGTSLSQLGTAMAYAVHDAALRLHELAGLAACAPTALRTTVIIAAIMGETMLVSQVGDGAVLVQRRDGGVVRVGATRETAWAGEVTCFVPDACSMVQAAELRQVSLADVALVALMTDGVDDPFHPLEQSAAQLVAQWREGTRDAIGTARQPDAPPVLGNVDALLRWLSFEQRGEVDDRTLLLAWR